jgi:hypothetical protein
LRSASAQIAVEFEEIEREEDRISNPVPAPARARPWSAGGELSQGRMYQARRAIAQ